ncbi:MAG: hypothetical protein WC730_01755 [Patescibacteria group bacterium]|jgi:hypothetical protein
MNAVNKPLSRTLRIYQKAALAFVIVALLSLLVVLYLSVSRATIRIEPKLQVASTTIGAEVTASPKTSGQVSGYVIERTYAKAEVYFIPEEGAVAVEKQAKGTVTLINETNSNQTLIATTRLLSEEGILFRLSEGATVPANGQVEALAYADQPGATGNINATQFTIPGLAADKQKVIYAVSVDAMQGGIEYQRVVAQADLDQAMVSMTDEVRATAATEMKALITNPDFDGAVDKIEILERVADVAPGTDAGSFTISATIKVTGVFYDASVIQEYAESDLNTRIAEGYELSSVNTDGLQVTIQSADPANETASLSIYLDGYSVISEMNSLFDKSRFIGKSAQEVIRDLSNSPDVASVSVNFTPFWLKRIPTLKDHITILIEKGK